MAKGTPGFAKIMYSGKEFDKLTVDDTTSTMSIGHIYRTTYFNPKNQPAVKGEHYCLQMGYLCPRQSLTHPLLALKLIWKKYGKRG